MKHVSMKHWVLLLFALSFAILVNAALAYIDTNSISGETPPTGCNNCGNYIRYGYIANDLATWYPTRGQWRIEQSGGNNRLRASVLAQSQARIRQDMILPQAFLSGMGEARRFWIEVQYRTLNPLQIRQTLTVNLASTVRPIINQQIQVNSSTWTTYLYQGNTNGFTPADHQLALQLFVDNTNIEVDNIRFWLENSVEVVKSCNSLLSLTEIGQAVSVELNNLNASGDNYYSARTHCTDLPGDTNPFARPWLMSNPDVREEPTIEDSDAYYRAIAEELRRTTSSFDVSSLHFAVAPMLVGETENLASEIDMVRLYLKPALRDLNTRFTGVPVEHRPVIRIFTAGEPFSTGKHADDIYRALVEGLREINVNLVVVEIGSVMSINGWNHTKIAVRDRQFAVTGGQNWEPEYIEIGEDGRPLHDLSVRLQGDGALETSRFLDKLWTRKSYCIGNLNLCWSNLIVPPNKLPISDYSAANVFTFGRGTFVTADIPGALDLSADLLTTAAFNAAESTIHISQHIMGPTDPTLKAAMGGDVDLFDQAIAGAVFRGVTIHNVISQPWNGPSLELQYQVWLYYFWVWGQFNGYTNEEIREAQCHFHYYGLHTYPGGPQRTHNKFWMVDEKAFYVGSQNLYYGGSGQDEINLNEFGFFIDGSNYANGVKALYWDPIWEFSASHEIIEPSLNCQQFKWQFETNDSIVSSPAMSNDGSTIYIGSFDNNLYALDADDGSLAWVYSTEGFIEASPAVGGDGTIYLPSSDHRLYALYPDGTLRWSFEVEGRVSSPAIGADGTVYIGTSGAGLQGCHLYAINPNTGSEIWDIVLGTEDCGARSPIVGLDGTIYTRWNASDSRPPDTLPNRLIAVNPDGTVEWSYIGQGLEKFGMPAIAADGTIIVMGYDLYGIDPDDGSLLWTYDMAAPVPTSGEDFSSPAIGVDGTIYVVDDTTFLNAISAGGGLLWRTFLDDPPAGLEWSSPAIGADGTIYVGSGENNLHAIAPQDGSVLWTIATSADILSSPTIGADGTVYVGNQAGYFYAFETDSPGLANSPWPKFRHDSRNTGLGH